MDDQLNKAIEILKQDFALSDANTALEGHDLKEQIIQKIAEYLETLLPTKSHKLFQILYRIDISEAQTQEAFDLGKVKLTARRLAEMIIDRQLKKLESQQSYDKSEDFS